ncbi:MAG: CDP-diacylglycerol--glycerol-3-phosphate 3-phosphatidyltransferase [Phycisphaerae bacterium]|nr:CDP-diacylglycerol--glycerol-3-phosphate 3-phosphatidyltransferase [Phycisphaerae bacterium]MCZ2398740.1 CDP-diacylglycerol--glycerol-3-phosphate 3-phosphatidyltransferase [Phycisphaerae bacterium]NUQ48604.1 CDP-diacylglycerol--glycerol-3-phosphate 3-phosphatidyltransferase [Phycisphaerae bacterium]
MRINVPNQITLGRLALAVLFFVLLSVVSADRIEQQRWLLAVGFWVFLAAVVTDVIDGYLARALNQETSFGRIIDPVVDKVVICGAFVFFAGAGFADAGTGTSIVGVQPWMAVVVMLRELLVSALRSDSESRGRDFAASWAGKLKMFIQSASVAIILGRLAWFPQLHALAVACVWLTVVATVASLLPYLGRARDALRLSQPATPGGAR